jgi:CubicO group peptidase (beta-lactamase class C family)
LQQLGLPGTPASPASLRSLDGVAREVVDAGVAPAAAVGFAKYFATGWEISVGGGTQSIWDLASLTKPMTAIAVARSGLDRRAEIGALVAETRGTPTARATLEELLAHRAGLVAHVLLPADGALEVAARSRRDDPRGAVYSDLGYILAGVALARHAKTVDAGEAIERCLPIAELGTARALRRAGLGFDARVEPTEGDLRGVVHDENARLLTGDGGSGHAGMFGSVRALLAFAIDAADFVAQGENAWMVRDWNDGYSSRAGFDGKSAQGSSAGSLHGPKTFGHLGFTGTSVWIDPEAKIVTTLLTNRVHPSRDNTRIREWRPRIHDALFSLASDARTSSTP